MEINEEVEILVEDLDETKISSLLSKWVEVNNVKKSIEKLDDMLKDKIKVFLKERNWDRYDDEETKISATISKIKKKSVDKNQLKILLTEAQMAQVIKITAFERIDIISPKAKERLNKYVRKEKI